MTVNTILVTGAFGQVGKRCTQILLERGRTVIAMDLRTDTNVAAEKELSAGAHPGTLIPAYADLLNAEVVHDLIATHRPERSFTSPASFHHCRIATPGWPEESTWVAPKIFWRRPLKLSKPLKPSRPCPVPRFSSWHPAPRFTDRSTPIATRSALLRTPRLTPSINRDRTRCWPRRRSARAACHARSSGSAGSSRRTLSPASAVTTWF